jgi:hypothetical protein
VPLQASRGIRTASTAHTYKEVNRDLATDYLDEDSTYVQNRKALRNRAPIQKRAPFDAWFGSGEQNRELELAQLITLVLG